MLKDFKCLSFYLTYICTYTKLLICIICLPSSFTGVKRLLWFIWKIIYIINRKGVPAAALLRHPPFDPACPSFLKFLCSLPSVLFHPLLRYSVQFTHPHSNPSCPNPTNQFNCFTSFTSSTVGFYQKSILNF